MKFTALGSRGSERKLISHFESHFQDLQRRLAYKGHEKGLRIIWLSVWFQVGESVQLIKTATHSPLENIMQNTWPLCAV